MNADFRLEDWIVRLQRHVIERGDESIHVRPKSMSVLECLVAAQGETVSRNELFDTVWPGGEVSDDTLTKCIVELRKAFHDTARESRVIETIPKLGFRLVPTAESLEGEPLAADQPPTESQQPRSDTWRKHRSVRPLIAAVLVFGVLLSFSSSRLWLTEAGVTLFLKTAAILSPPRLEQTPGIAVLPFVNMSSDPENEYFSDGMSEEILNALANTNRLPVIARSSSFQFKGQNRDIKEIGRLLGVTHVLEGSVRKAGTSIRVTAQLVDTATGAHVWSEVYQRELSDIFILQNEITKDIVHQISVALGDEIAPLPIELPTVKFMQAHPTDNLEAYDLYLKGVQMVTSNRPTLIEQAPDYFDRAIALDENYADAWAAKGWALGILGYVGSGSTRIPASVYPGALAAARRALEIDPEHAFATGWLGVLLMSNDFKWEEGIKLLRRGLALNPNDAAMLSIYGFYMDILQIEGASEIMEKAYRLDPFGLEPIENLAIHLRRKGRLLEAAILMETVLIEDLDGYEPNYFSARYNLQLGRLGVAEERLRKARLVANPVDLNLDALGWLIDYQRGTRPRPPLAETMVRLQTEHLYGAVLWDGWTDEKTIVDVFDLAIKQRHPELRSVLFGPKPPLMPEADWVRIKSITGATEFQDSEFYNNWKSGKNILFR